ncbi:MAG: class I SAM-dependent methyltransferase [Anaerolineales bacterium]|nr:class I SAM-dependent methyltransferase [Anaerolineales bacterium]
MPRFTDQNYLAQDQYKNSANLDARIALHQNFSVNPQGWYHWIFETLMQFPANAKILELGCGTGAMWQECADQIPAGWQITLTDLSDGMLDSAWKNLVVTGRSFKFEKADAQSIPYQDQNFDLVIANHMLYHVPDRIKALTEIKRVLKAGGSLIATTVGDKHMQEMYGWLKGVNLNRRADMFDNPFILENGAAEIEKVFASVTLTRYADHLEVTAVEPIIKYIRSSIGADDLSEERLSAVEKELTANLERNGKIFITKDSGMFRAMK